MNANTPAEWRYIIENPIENGEWVDGKERLATMEKEMQEEQKGTGDREEAIHVLAPNENL